MSDWYPGGAEYDEVKTPVSCPKCGHILDNPVACSYCGQGVKNTEMNIYFDKDFWL